MFQVPSPLNWQHPSGPHAVLNGAQRCTGGARNVRRALEAKGFNLSPVGTPKLKKKLESLRKAVLLMGGM